MAGLRRSFDSLIVNEKASAESSYAKIIIDHIKIEFLSFLKYQEPIIIDYLRASSKQCGCYIH